MSDSKPDSTRAKLSTNNVGWNNPCHSLAAAVLPYLPARARYILLKALNRTECTWPQARLAILKTAMMKSQAERLFERSTVISDTPGDSKLQYQTPMGPFWVTRDCDIPLFSELLAEQEAEIYGDEESGVRPGDIVIDCGANYGIFIRKALSCSADRVIALEPAPLNCECIAETFAGEIGNGTVTLIESAAWFREGSLPFAFDPRYSWASTVLDSAQSVQMQLPRSSDVHSNVNATTIDNVVKRLDLPSVEFIKLDIEGSEGKALAGARDTIRRFRPRVAVTVYHRPQDRTEIPSLLLEILPSYSVTCIHACDRLTTIRTEVLLFS